MFVMDRSFNEYTSHIVTTAASMVRGDMSGKAVLRFSPVGIDLKPPLATLFLDLEWYSDMTGVMKGATEAAEDDLEELL